MTLLVKNPAAIVAAAYNKDPFDVVALEAILVDPPGRKAYLTALVERAGQVPPPEFELDWDAEFDGLVERGLGSLAKERLTELARDPLALSNVVRSLYEWLPEAWAGPGEELLAGLPPYWAARIAPPTRQLSVPSELASLRAAFVAEESPMADKLGQLDVSSLDDVGTRVGRVVRHAWADAFRSTVDPDFKRWAELTKSLLRIEPALEASGTKLVLELDHPLLREPGATVVGRLIWINADDFAPLDGTRTDDGLAFELTGQPWQAAILALRLHVPKSCFIELHVGLDPDLAEARS